MTGPAPSSAAASVSAPSFVAVAAPVLSGGMTPASFRAGYAAYLRTAKIGEIAGLGFAGLLGLVALAAVGGMIGYRQAKAGLAVRAGAPVRFLQ